MGINRSIISGVTLFQGFRNTGVQEFRRYRSIGVQEIQEIQECQVSGHIIIMNMPGNTGARCQVSGVIYHMANIACQIPVSYIKCQI